MKFITTLSLFLCISVSMLAQSIRVQGVVKSSNNQPIAGVLIYNNDTNETYGSTNDDGRFSILVERNVTLLFTSVGCKDHREKLKGRVQLDITMAVEAVALEEVEIVSTVKNKVIPEPTEIEVVGNYFHLRTRFRIPKEMFRSNTRLIFQPTIMNVTEKTTRRLKPVVVDGREYMITQNRLYGFDSSGDPLKQFVITKDSLLQDEIAMYHDSMFVKNPRQDFKADVDISLENYNKITYIDSTTIARGTVNPLRFFEYDLECMNLTDEQYLPKPEMQLCDDRGEVRLTFQPSKAAIDMNDTNSAAQLRELQQRLREIELDPNSTLLSFAVNGIASPDGPYKQNVKLASARTENAMKQILSLLSTQTREYMELSSSSNVESWQSVVNLMNADSLPEAQKLQDAIAKRSNNIEEQWRAALRLPFYKSLISTNYLPRLRRVEYSFKYSVFRKLSVDEIRELYKRDYKKLTRFEFYTLICGTEGKKFETLCRQAIEVYPKFMWAANELAVYLLQEKRQEIALLEPFINDKAPASVVVNHIIANLMDNNISTANELMSKLPADASLDELKSIISILNGNYALGYELYSKRGGLNEVLILLAMKRNDEACDKIQKLPMDNARNLYVKAVATNRLDKVMDAIMSLDKAFDMDPSLRELAKLDGDLLDLLD